MSTSESSSDAILLDDIADEFTRRQRDGERPTIDEYVRQHPKLEAAIRQVLETLKRVEIARPGESEPSTPAVIYGADGKQITQLGEYRILREIGRGGMGVVFEAEQVSLGRRVALKALPQASKLDPQHYARFQLEARATAQLEHPHIVPIHSVGEDDNLHYFTMQYIEGPGLGQVLNEVRLLRNQLVETKDSAATVIARAMRNQELGAVVPNQPDSPTKEKEDSSIVPPANLQSSVNARDDSTAVNAAASGTLVSLSDSSRDTFGSKYYRNVALIGVQISSALEYAHGHGILHRDVKPSNILLDLRGKAWITDFGLAKTEGDDDVTNTGDIVGTLRYMAPERFDGWADRRSDVYSLGLTLYELATLQPAFSVADRAQLIQSIRTASCPSPRTIEGDIAPDLETIILKAIAREPGQRYRSAGDLGQDLDRFLAGQPIHARRTSAFEKLRLWTKRNPLVASLVCMLFVALTAGFATSTWYWHEATLRATAAKTSEDKAVAMAEIARQQEAEATESRVLAARQRDVALSKAQDLRAAIDQLFTAISGDPELKKVGMEKFRRTMLERANEYYDQFHNETPDDVELAREHAELTYKLAQMNYELGDLKTAKRLFASVIEQVDESPTPNPHLFHVAYKCRLSVADCSWNLGEADDQMTYLIRQSERFIETHSADMAAKFLTECAHMATSVGRSSDAHRLCEKADELYATITPSPGMARQHDFRVALNCTVRSRLAIEVEQFEDCRTAAQRAIDLLKPYGPSMVVDSTIADMEYLIAVSLSREGRHEESSKSFESLIDYFTSQMKAHPDVVRHQTLLINYHYQYGLDLHRQGRQQEALKTLSANLAEIDKAVAKFPETLLVNQQIRADSLIVLCGVHARLGNFDQMGSCAEMAIDTLESIGGEDKNTLILTSLGIAWTKRARAYGHSNTNPAKQIAAFDRAIEILEKVISIESRPVLANRVIAEACLLQAQIYVAENDTDNARTKLLRAIELNMGEFSDQAKEMLQQLNSNEQ